MGQRGSLNFMERARVAKTKREMDHARLRSPRMYCKCAILIGLDKHVAIVHAQDGSTHAIHEADRLVQVLGQDNSSTCINLNNQFRV